MRLAASGHARYVPTPTGAAGRLEQRLHLNAMPAAARAQAKTGDTLAHSVLVFYPNQPATQTRATAAQCALLSAPGATTVRLRLEDATEVTFDLAALRIDVAPRQP